MAQFVMTHLLGLCLFCIRYTRQDSCSAPGNLTSPELFLSTSSGVEEEDILVTCQLPLRSKFSRVILCKDGKETKTLEGMDNIFEYSFRYKISEKGAGQISCMFQFKDINNQVKNSGLSDVKYLGARSDILSARSDIPSLGFGISTSAILMLAVVFYLLKKRGVIKWRSTREQHGSSSAMEMENQPSKDD